MGPYLRRALYQVKEKNRRPDVYLRSQKDPLDFYTPNTLYTWGDSDRISWKYRMTKFKTGYRSNIGSGMPKDRKQDRGKQCQKDKKGEFTCR